MHRSASMSAMMAAAEGQGCHISRITQSHEMIYYSSNSIGMGYASERFCCKHVFVSQKH